MPERIVWIDRVETKIEGAVVHVTSGSGDETFRSCMARGAYRQHLERALRQLDKADTDEECVVLGFPLRECG